MKVEQGWEWGSGGWERCETGSCYKSQAGLQLIPVLPPQAPGDFQGAGITA